MNRDRPIQATTPAELPLTGDFRRDAQAFSAFWRNGAEELATLPGKSARNEAQARAAEQLLRAGRVARERFLARHGEAVYGALTGDLARFVRIDALLDAAARLVPGLTPSPAVLAAESALAQRDKDGLEIDQGIFLAHVLGHQASGLHLCHAMLLPKPESHAHLTGFAARGTLTLATFTVERRGKAAFVTLRNPRFLNAEDASTMDDFETAIDVATLDPASDIVVLRGGVVDHEKYRRRVFGSGINLTHLYQGRIPFHWYMTRELGIVNKIFRGVANADAATRETDIAGTEKPWVAAVDAFAIGGACQLLLVMDYVLAANDAYLSLPARKEGIIPGAANLRLPRFTGDRIARQAIMAGRRLDCDSPEGRLICDEVVPPGDMDAALDRVVDLLTGSGVVSAAGNRRAFRVGQEPLDLFRRAMAVYAREQATCHFSPALIANLERHWNAQERKV